MVPPIFQQSLASLRQRGSLKWQLYDPDVLPLWVAEMDAAPCEAVVSAVCAAVSSGDTGYPWAPPYAEALSGFAEQRWGWSFDPGTASLVPDVMIGVSEVLRVLTDPGDPVIISPPVYPPFYGFVQSIDRHVLEAPLSADLRLDPDALECAFSRARAQGGRAAYLLCNPHNPTGTVHTPEELAAVALLAERHGVRVVVDEIHAPVVYPGSTFTPYLAADPTGLGIAVMAPSKAWNLAGLKAALAIPGPAARTDLSRLPEVVSHGASHLGVISHTAALLHGMGWLDELLVELDAHRQLLADLLARQLPSVGYRPPDATYLAWLDCRELGLGEDPASAFLDRGRVAVNPGLDFGPGGAGRVRLNLATSPQIITEAVGRMASVVAG